MSIKSDWYPHSRVACLWLLYSVGEVGSSVRDSMACKTENIYYVAHLRKSLLLPVPNKAILGRRTEPQHEVGRHRKMTAMKWPGI